MAAIILPDRWGQFPTGQLELDEQHWLVNSGGVLLYAPLDSQGGYINGRWMTFATDQVARRGDAQFDAHVGNFSANYIEHTAAVKTAAPLTLLCWANRASLAGEIPVSISRSGGSDRFVLQHNADGTVSALASTSTAVSSATTSTFSVNTWFYSAARFDSYTYRIAGLNGVYENANTTSKVPASLNRTLIGSRILSGAYNTYTGKIANALILNYGLLDNDFEALYYEQRIAPYAMLRPRKRVLYFSVSSGATDLTIQDSSHAQAADNAGLTTQWLLTVADAAHAHTADGPTLTVASVLAVADALHAHVAENLDLSTTGATNLTIQDATHTHDAADALTLVTDWLLTVADALHSHAADNVALSLAGAENLIVQGAAHAHAADNVGLTTDAWLAIADSVHAHLADGVTLTTASVLAILEAVHAHAAEVLDLFFSSFTEAQLQEILAYVEANMAVPTTAEIAVAVWAEILSGSSAADRLVGMAAAILSAAQAAPIHADLRKVRGQDIDGAGTEADPWGPA